MKHLELEQKFKHYINFISVVSKGNPKGTAEVENWNDAREDEATEESEEIAPHRQRKN